MFQCRTFSAKGCSAHYIHERQLETIVLDDLRRVTHYAWQVDSPEEEDLAEIAARDDPAA